MSTAIQYVYRQVDGLMKQQVADFPTLGPKDILIKITHSSLCGTDLAYIPYGIVPGHEGVGIVTAIGSAVTQFAIGERAGGGYLRDACGSCNYCLNGQDIWCYNRATFGSGDATNMSNGTFSTYFVGTETFLHKIPDNIPSEFAAPLQCAGATVYSAIVDIVKPRQRVGVFGIGGLGHLAIQFAAKLGAEVIVFSTSPNKEAEARSFGASEFYLSSKPEDLKKPIDVLLVAGKKYPDWSKFLVKEVLARAGTIIPLAEPDGNIELNAFNVFFEGYNLHSSLVASRHVHDDMLDFAARHNIRPVIEKFELTEEGLNKAVDQLKSGNMRYRGVLVAAE